MTTARKRVAIASLMQETNTFSPLETTIAVFESYYVLRGEQLRTGYGPARVEVPGMLAVLDAAGVEAVPLYAAYAAASGTVVRRDFDVMVGEIDERLAAAGPVDGLLLAHPDELRAAFADHRALVRADAPRAGRVGIVTGGGSGHLPTFLVYVGEGLCSGVAVGNVFSSPSSQPRHRSAFGEGLIWSGRRHS